MARSPLHHASLIDPALHSPALLELLGTKLSKHVLEYIIDCVVDTVDYAMGRPSSSSRGRSHSRRAEHVPFARFVHDVLTRAEATIPTILVSLVYTNRAKPHLQIALEEWACERVFLGAIIVASKYLNDSTLKNVDWALCTGVFGKRDVGRIEREFLDVLDFELSVTEDDLLSHHDALSAVVLPSRMHRRRVEPHNRTHHRPATHAACPDLDPSSPKSSSSGSSPEPRTPEILVDPAYGAHPRVLHVDGTAPVVQVPSKTYQPVPTTMDIIRAFPLPVSHSYSYRAPSAPSHKPHHHPSHHSYYPMTQIVA